MNIKKEIKVANSQLAKAWESVLGAWGAGIPRITKSALGLESPLLWNELTHVGIMSNSVALACSQSVVLMERKVNKGGKRVRDGRLDLWIDLGLRSQASDYAFEAKLLRPMNTSASNLAMQVAATAARELREAATFKNEFNSKFVGGLVFGSISCSKRFENSKRAELQKYLQEYLGELKSQAVQTLGGSDYALCLLELDANTVSPVDGTIPLAVYVAAFFN